MKQRTAIVWLILLTMIWGSTYPILGLLLDETDPFSLMFFRFVIAGVMMLAIFYKQFTMLTREQFKYCMWITFPYLLGMFSQLIGLKYSGPTNAAFITSLTVLVVPLILWIKDKAVLKRTMVVGTIFATIGITMMTLQTNFTFSIGDLIIFFSMFSFSFFVYILGKYGQQVQAGVLTTIQFLCLVIVSFPFVITTGEFYYPKDWITIAVFVFLILVCSIFAMFLHNKVQPFVPTALVGIIFLLEPVSAAILSWLMGEELTARQIVGAIIILMSLFFTIRMPSRKIRGMKERT